MHMDQETMTYSHWCRYEDKQPQNPYNGSYNQQVNQKET